jgi:hypothetical protein
VIADLIPFDIEAHITRDELTMAFQEIDHLNNEREALVLEPVTQ